MPLPNLSPSAVAASAPSAGILAPLAAEPAPTAPTWAGHEPLTLVFPDKFAKGRNSIMEATACAKTAPLQAALEARYGTDAHFLCYGLTQGGKPLDTRESGAPRLNKMSLPSIRAAGMDVATNIITLDYDNHGPDGKKAPWADGQLDAFVARVCAAEGVLAQFACLYSTKNGARLVYLLDKAIPVEHAEPKIAGLISLWSTAAGLAFDPACCDWTRFFRAPFVVRDGVEQRPAVYEFFAGVTAAAHEIPNDFRMASFASDRKNRGLPEPKGMPSPETCQKLLEVEDKDGKKPSAWAKTAKSALTGRPQFPFCYENIDLLKPTDTNWNSTAASFCGGIVNTLAGKHGATAEGIFAVALSTIERIEDEDGADWHAIFWDMIVRFWGKASADRDVELEVEQKQVAKAATIEDTIIAGVRTWAPAEVARGTDDDVWAWARERLVIACAGNYYVMQEDGHYGDNSIDSSNLIPDLLRAGMDKLLGLTEFDVKAGKDKFVAATELLNKCCQSVKSVYSEPGKVGGTLCLLSRDNRILYTNSYRLSTKLKPAYDAEVDQWLRYLVGNEKGYNELCNWLAYAPDFTTRPICALSLTGNAGCGKGMLKAALEQLLDTPASATADDLVGKYQYGLLRSPFLCIDEGFPVAEGFRHPADAFRSMVSGNEMVIDQKFKAPVNLKAYPRVVLMSNNIDLTIGKFVEGRHLTAEDREALEQRLMHLPVGRDASAWLEAMGGYAFTKCPKKGQWVDGTDPEKDFRIPRHILWLHERRDPNPQGRFLVMGNRHPDVLYKMQAESGATGIVIDGLIALIEGDTPRRNFGIVDGKAYYLLEAVQDAVREIAGKRRERASSKSVSEAMKSLSLPAEGEFLLKGREDMGEREWRRINVRVVKSVAKKEGKTYKKLNDLLEE